jgi:hypothetical protein
MNLHFPAHSQHLISFLPRVFVFIAPVAVNVVHVVLMQKTTKTKKSGMTVNLSSTSTTTSKCMVASHQWHHWFLKLTSTT